MNWKKLGQLYECNGLHQKLLSHAANPLAVNIAGDVYRVFFSARDAQNRSSVGAVDIDLTSRKVVRQFNQPFFEFGAEESFYSHGVSVGNSYEIQGQIYILFMGWHIPSGSHWMGEIGRLKVNKDFSLSLDSDTPFMELDEEDPISLSYPWVIYHENLYKMWYGSTVTWDNDNGEMVHVIKYAESNDGHIWNKKGLAIPYELGVAQAFSRPSVWVDAQNTYHMWYSFRSGTGQSYRIGYAQSKDGMQWQRLDKERSIGVCNLGWDSEMVEYPFVFKHLDGLYMLYNGNDFGRSGFGLATVEE